MKKSQRLLVLVKIEEAKEREEARKFSDFQKTVEGKRKKLFDLESYLDEYKRNFLEISRIGTSADRIKSSYAFLSQLNAAIIKQQALVQDAEEVSEKYRLNWIQAKQRMDILEKTIDKFRGEETRQEQKLEQKFADELSLYKQRDR